MNSFSDDEEESPKGEKDDTHVIQTFPKLSKRPSKYKLFDAPTDKDPETVFKDIESLTSMIKKLDQEKFHPSIPKKVFIKDPTIKTTKKSKTPYKEDDNPKNLALPTILSVDNSDGRTMSIISKKTTKNENMTEFSERETFERDDYYMKYQGDDFGLKYKTINPRYITYDDTNKEEFYYHNGISDSNFELKSKFFNHNLKKKIKMKEMNKIEFKLIEAAHAQMVKKIKKNHHKTLSLQLSPSYYKNRHYEEFCEEIERTKQKVFTLTKKKEFTEILVSNYIKKNIPDFNLIPKKNFRKIFVIKNSTVLTNFKVISGLVFNIPIPESLRKYTPHKRQVILNNFLQYCQDKFNSQIKFEYLYLNDGIVVNDLMDIDITVKFIFVCPTSLFEGLSIPLNKNVLRLYKKYFPDKDVKNGAYTDSSIDEEVNEDDTHEIRKDVFELFFGKKKNKLSLFKKKSNQRKLFKKTFSDGIKNTEEYLYYSDNEERRNEAIHIIKNQKISNKKPKKVDYFITSENIAYTEKVNILKDKLSSRRKRNLSTLTEPNALSDIKLTNAFLTEKKIKKHFKNKTDKVVKKKFTTKDLLDSLKILKQRDPSLNLSKFYLHSKDDKKELPKIEENIVRNTNKYCQNENIINKEFPHLLSYNIPLILSKHPKYTRNELVTLFSQFKMLVNLWLNVHSTTKVAQYGIDFDIFHSCVNEMSQEEEILAKKIFNEINTSFSGMLNLEDFIGAMTILNRRELKDQIEFFLNVFDTNNKGEFSLEEVKTICKMSIKRLIKNFKNSEADIEVLKELSQFFAEYIYKKCGCDIRGNLSIDKLRHLIDSNSKELEYLEVFCCIYKNR